MEGAAYIGFRIGLIVFDALDGNKRAYDQQAYRPSSYILHPCRGRDAVSNLTTSPE